MPRGQRSLKEKTGPIHSAPVYYDSAKTAMQAVLVNLGVTVLRFALAFASNSVALMGDAWHHLKDVAASFSIYLSIRFAGLRSQRFSYGLYKLEDMAALGMSLLIFFVGFELVQEVLGAEPHAVRWVGPTLVFLLLSLVIKFSFGTYERHVAKQTHSPALFADAQHFFADVWSTLVVMLGLVGELFHLHLEKVTTLVVVGIIWLNAARTFLKASMALLDVEAEEPLRQSMLALASADARIQDISLTTRKAGSRLFVEADLDLRPEVGYEEASNLCLALEQEFYTHFPQIAQVKIHYHRCWHEGHGEVTRYE